ncbi:tRNA epoxyqueuosine(34) reductase QueG [Ramlibacter terrae]|uniref:tRNA epoxyqueuosine(34) reductase QueG n=1 Tax=Ramlibacter terrae TaxID=2732511 RepID=A0ABX6P439_9BURK|nr:tRNA epoxyqueuosine(34) reductase QueG [Ramlibacter terrae]
MLDREGGSMFFPGEIYVDLALPPTEPVTDHCGTCTACIDICPTNAIVAPYRVDARRCISYLTIEHPCAIPIELRPLMANRIYGCDDCQLTCPWNKFAQRSPLPDFAPRDHPVGQPLVSLFAWSEDEFLRYTEGSPIRRIGHERWLRNIAVALGNALRAGDDPDVRAALRRGRSTRARWCASTSPGRWGVLKSRTFERRGRGGCAESAEGLPCKKFFFMVFFCVFCVPSAPSAFKGISPRPYRSTPKANGRLASPSSVDSVTSPATSPPS